MVKIQITGLVELDRLRTKLEYFKEDLNEFFQSRMNSDWKLILLEMQYKNLAAGIRPDLTSIEKTPTGNQKSTKYERYTEWQKNKLGLNTDVVTLKDKGDFWRDIDIKVGADVIYFIDRNWKSELIESVWGQVLGVTEDQLFEFTQKILPEFETWVINRFNG